MAQSVASGACTLPYPNKFQAAVSYVASESTDLPDEVQLVLYGLQRQAEEGPCTEPKPWGWNVEESHKHAAWSGLEEMAPMEAMRLYVRTLEEEQMDWWPKLQSSGGTAAAVTANGVAAQPVPKQNGTASAGPLRSATSASEAGSWTAAPVGGERRPGARYEHAVALCEDGRRMFVVGGNSGGRYLADTWVLDLATLTWAPAPSSSRGGAPPPPSSTPPSTPPPPTPPAMPPTAGHALVPWQGSLLSIGGHIKASGKGKGAEREAAVLVRVLDTKAMTWSVLSPSGDAPPARGSHSATLVGGKAYVFGGEDAARRPLGDLHVLDLADMSWSAPETSSPAPPPRSAHAATAYADRWLLVFGGGSLVHCFSDLHILDTHTGAWSRPVTSGPVPSARAGHAGDVLGDTWYIVGGGNNTAGCADLVALDLSPLKAAGAAQPAAAKPAEDDTGGQSDGSELEAEETAPLVWSHVVDVEPRSAIASEGLSLLAVPSSGVLVSFGGYNGKYHADVHLFRPGQEEGTGAVAQAAAAVAQPLGQLVDSAKQPLQQLVEAALPGQSKPEASPDRQQQGGKPPPAKPPPAVAASGSSSEWSELKAQLEQANQRADASAAEAAAAKETVGRELALMRRQLSHAQSALAGAEQAAEEAKAALSAEQGRSFKLEAQVAELRQALARTSDLERELKRARAQLEDAEASTKKGGGLFGYITGAS